MFAQKVTPFVGVWIETSLSLKLRLEEYVTPFVGVWIETKFLPEKLEMYHCHTLRGCVDWNADGVNLYESIYSHTLRGCVDWNIESPPKEARR